MPTKSFIRHPIMQPGLHSTSGPHMPHCVARWREWVGITKAVRLPLCLTAKGSRRRHHKCLHMKCSGRGMHFSCGIEIKHREHRKKNTKHRKNLASGLKMQRIEFARGCHLCHAFHRPPAYRTFRNK